MIKKAFGKIDKIPEKGVGVIEWVIFALFAVFSYIFFCHQDILITAGHSIEYLNGHITDFYSACYKVDGTYSSNYLPSTFIIFAIWNIPIKLLGLAPEWMGDWTLTLTMWNKLLPTIVFFASGVLLYRLCTDRFAFGKSKAMLTVFLTFTCPMAFFSQFFFCQYDIFTVLFMLLGMYYYFKEKPKARDYILFALFFGIATTFKYFALVIFVVMLLLKIKDIFKDILLIAISVFPAFAEIAFYMITDRRAFVKSVFNFKALDYAGGFTVDLGEVSINLMYVALLVIIAFAYFTKPKDFDSLVGYSMFYSCGVCFAFFGMMLWHPQWVLFMVPFWILSTVINKNHNVLLWIDALCGLVLIVYIVNQFQVTVDQGLLRYGVLYNLLRYKQVATFRMCDFFIFKDADTLFSVLSAIFLIGFIFKHPKFNFERINEEIKEGRFIVNVRFVAFCCAFIIAAFACLPNFMDRPDNLFRRDGGSDLKIVTIDDKAYASEFAQLDKMTVRRVYVVCDKAEDTEKDEKAKIFVDIIDTETGETVAHGQGKVKDIKDESHNFTKLKLEKDFTPEQDRLYEFRFYTEQGSQAEIYFEKNPTETASYYRIKQREYDGCYAMYNGEDMQKREVVMRLTGDALS
ncbi:MAG: ArnT family glycosyltransferase [Eubacterium sp.]